MPKSFEHTFVDGKLDYTSTSGGYSSPSLSFLTPTLSAVDSVLRLLLMSGAHVNILGSRGSGKSKLVGDLLLDLHSASPTPQQIRGQVTANLMNIVTERQREPLIGHERHTHSRSHTNPTYKNKNNKSRNNNKLNKNKDSGNGSGSTSGDSGYREGIAATLSKLRDVLRALLKTKPKHDNDTDFSSCWQVVQLQLLDLLTKGAKAHCQSKTVFVANTSVRVCDTASSLRNYITREFCTEIDNVLETPRYNHGILFIDDLHLCDDPSSTSTRGTPEAEEVHSYSNRPEAFLKGVLDPLPLFGIHKNLSPEVMGHSGYHGRKDGLMKRQMYDMPTVHRPVLTDPRSRLLGDDQYHMQRIGVVSAMTGDYSSLCKNHVISPLFQHFATIALPSFTSTQIHASLVVGAQLCMQHHITTSGSDSNIVHVLRPELIELCKNIVTVASKMIPSTSTSGSTSTSTSNNDDLHNTTHLERAVRNVIAFDLANVKKLCNSIGHGAPSISNKGGLLQLCLHEWERDVLDALPDGNQRERLVDLMKNELRNNIDASAWYIREDWFEQRLQSIGEGLKFFTKSPVVAFA
jgi:hypothetical protein